MKTNSKVKASRAGVKPATARSSVTLETGKAANYPPSDSGAMERLRANVESAKVTAGVPLKGLGIEELERLAVKHKLGVNMNGWKNPYPQDDPRSLLLEYQFAWREDMSRFKAALMARQSGKDFSSESEAAEDCYRRSRTEWMIAAPSERQSVDSLEQGKMWAEAFDLKVHDYQERREGGSDTLLKSAEIIFSNGSRMRAVPGKPDTVRGRSANILLTEFDFFENAAATWRAMLPSITNPLRGGEKKVRIITTPNGQGGAMHSRIWTKKDTAAMSWSRHLVTIYHAVLMGLPVDITQLREVFADPDGWAQEFCCQFLDAAAVLLPYELIAQNESIEAEEAAPADFWSASSARQLDMGIDFGRKKDLTVAWTAEKVSDMQITREVLTLEKTPTPEQVRELEPRILKVRRVCLDYTGPGIGLGDYLVERFGEWNPEKHKYGKIELVTFSNTVKVDLFAKLRMAMERRGWRVPVNTVIREDLHSVYRVVTPNGMVSYRAPSSPDGHADRCAALALCTRAGEGLAYSGLIIPPSGRRAAILAGRKERSLEG